MRIVPYDPKPSVGAEESLPKRLLVLAEDLAAHNHDVWARGRLDEGWRHGPQRDDVARTHPDLVPYDELPDGEKAYDRAAALGTLHFIVARGWTFVPPSHAAPAHDDLLDLERQLQQVRDRDQGLGYALRLWEMHSRAGWAQQPSLYRVLGEHLLRLGEPLAAYDVVREGLGLHPETVRLDRDLEGRLQQLRALALARSGATTGAREVIEALAAAGWKDEETTGILTRVRRDDALRSTDPEARASGLASALEGYLAGFRGHGSFWLGINAATVAALLGRDELAASLSREVESIVDGEIARLSAHDSSGAGDQDQLYWALATRGDARLVRKDVEGASRAYTEAAAVAGRHHGLITATRRQARLLVAHLGLDWSALDRALPAPTVVVFCGHMIDDPTRRTPRFPLGRESAVGVAIRARLDAMGPGPVIGFSSAAGGADILFLEALQARGDETVVVLPYEAEAFAADSIVGVPGPRWRERFDAILASATQRTTVSVGRLPWGNLSYDYANEVLLGLAMLRAAHYETSVRPLTVWDGRAGDGPGGTAWTVGFWNEVGLEWERIDPSPTPSAGRGEPPERLHPPSASPGVEAFGTATKAALFADVKGFSGLAEQQIPRFVEGLLGLVGDLVRTSPAAPIVSNTWGDGLYMVFDDVAPAGIFALELAQRVAGTDWTRHGLPDLQIRIALNFGPVFHCVDPVTQQETYTGTHVTRAARLEPVTPPNQVYATEAFAAIAAVRRVTAFVCEYVGVAPLAKRYGRQPVYHVRMRGTATQPT